MSAPSSASAKSKRCYVAARDQRTWPLAGPLGCAAAALTSSASHSVAQSVFVRPLFPARFKYLVVDVADRVTEAIVPHFAEFDAFVDNALAAGGKCLIHSNAGISRAGAFVVQYVMQRLRLDFEVALRFVQSRRFCVSPNGGFAQQLQNFGTILDARRKVAARHAGRAPQVKRRKDVLVADPGGGTWSLFHPDVDGAARDAAAAGADAT